MEGKENEKQARKILGVRESGGSSPFFLATSPFFSSFCASHFHGHFLIFTVSIMPESLEQAGMSKVH